MSERIEIPARLPPSRRQLLFGSPSRADVKCRLFVDGLASLPSAPLFAMCPALPLMPIPFVTPIFAERFLYVTMGSRPNCCHVSCSLFCGLWVALLEAYDDVVWRRSPGSGVSRRMQGGYWIRYRPDLHLLCMRRCRQILDLPHDLMR